MPATATRPLAKRFLMRKSSNAENQPPASKKADALVRSAREASRRRRARVVSGSTGPLKTKKIIQNAQRRASKAQQLAASKSVKLATPEQVQLSAPVEPVEIVNQVTDTTPAPAPTTATPTPNLWRFPTWLRRPPPEVWPVPLRRENVDACNPDLVGTHMDYIMQGLEATGESMWELTVNAEMENMGPRVDLPDEIDVVIPTSAEQSAGIVNYPTHVFAVWDLPISQPVIRGAGINPATGRRRVSLVAAHNLVMAAHCAKWFPLPSSTSVKTQTVPLKPGVNTLTGTKMNLPVVPLGVPHPQSFGYLLHTLYTKKVSWLLDQLVPVPKPAVIFPTPANPNPQNRHYILETARRVARQYTPHHIVKLIGMVIGLWQNAIYLGISDRRTWIGIDWSYDMLLNGLAMSLGHREAFPRPQPQHQWPARSGAAPNVNLV